MARFDDDESGSAQFLEFAHKGGLGFLGGVGDVEGDEGVWSGDGARTVTELQGMIDLGVRGRHFGYFETRFLSQPVMHALAEEDVVGKFAFTGKCLNFAGVGVQPSLPFAGQLIERRGKLVITDELQAEALEGEENSGERTGHHGALFVGPIEFEGVGAETSPERFEDCR